MERQFRLNWPVIIEEAKQRRKRQRLTQERLASLAGISTPTVSRFENGAKDIQLSSVTAILSVLGMIDDRELLFPNPEARYEFDRDLVLFDGQVRGEAILCGISREALEDHFDRGKKGLVQMYKANYGRIHHEARRKYLSAQFESDGSVLIKTLDL